MNALPINKIFLAGFAFALTHWKKIIEISILPIIVSIPFFLVVLPMIFELDDLGKLLVLASQGGDQKGVVDILERMVWPDNVFLYLILFLYGHLMLSINIYRLVILGRDSVAAFKPNSNAVQIFRFIGLTFFLGFVFASVTVLTFFLSLGSLGGIFQLIVYFLIIPITLNFVSIATDQPSKYKWNLSFTTHMNLFFLQAILPALVGMLFAALSNIVGLGSILEWVAKVVVFYWTLVTLALCYQLIQTNSSA